MAKNITSFFVLIHVYYAGNARDTQFANVCVFVNTAFVVITRGESATIVCKYNVTTVTLPIINLNNW